MNKKLLCLTPLLAVLLCAVPVFAQDSAAEAAAYMQDFQKMEGFDGPQIRAADPLFSAIGENPAIGAAAQVVNRADIAAPAGPGDVPGGALPVFTDDLGDFSFFKSDYITHRYTAYPNTTLYPKSNEIECEKFDYQNPNKGDRIIFHKTADEDCYIDVASKIFTTYRSAKTYKHFKLSGEFRCDFEGDSSLYLFQLRGNRGGSQVNVYPVTVNSDGSVKLLNGQTVSDAAATGKWMRITMYLNLETHKLTLFLDGEKVLDGAALPNELQNLDMTRIQCRSGQYTGTLQCRHLEFTGLDKAYAGQPEGEETRTSMFGDDQEIRDYLADKTCFHFYGKNIYARGGKSDMTAEPVYRDGVLYVPLEDFNRAYGCEAVLEDGRISLGSHTAVLADKPLEREGVQLIPVMETASALLGEHVFDDTNGLVITSPQPLPFDAEDEVPYHKRKIDTGYIDRFTPLQYIYDYLLFDRPDRETLLQDFNAATGNGQRHPRIMASADDFDCIRELSKTDPYMKMVAENLIAMANSDCREVPISFAYQDALRTTTVADRLRDRVMRCGFAYQMTGDQKYVDCAWKNLNALDGFPDINPGHPIDTGSYGAGIAIGYDWFYDAFTEAQRQNIRENAMRLHLTVMSEGFYGRSPVRGGPDGNINVVGYYNKWISNYNAWTNSGSLMMALAFMEDYPETCSDLLRHTIRSLEYTFKNLYPDGAWVESTNYWSIVARSMAYIYPSLQEVYGTDFKLSCFPGTEGTGLTNLALRSMVSSYNYHDAGSEGSYGNYVMPFLGVYFNQPELLAARYATLTQAYDSRMKKISPDVFDALFYDPDVTVDAVKNMPRSFTARGLELFSVHEDYTKYDGLFLGAHGGPVTFYHSHNDGGDFVFDLNGVRWACALAAEDYNSTLSGSERYRMRTEGHNTITINNGKGMNQLSNTYAPIIAAEEGEEGAFAVYDMSASYADADKFLRGFYVGDNYRSLTIRDEIELNKDNSEIYWFMHTQAAAEVLDARTVRLTSGGKSLIVNFEAEADTAEVSIMAAKPLPSSPQGEGQNPNSGFRKVAVRLTGSGKVTLTVRLGEIAGTVDQTPIAQWQIAAHDPEPPVQEPDFALRYGKEKSGTVAAASLQLDLASRLGQAGDYDFTFDLYPELETGSFNFYLGGYYQLVYGADGYVLRCRQKDDADFTEQGTYHIGRFVPIRVAVHGRETADLYIGGQLAIEGLHARDGYDFAQFGIVLNNGMRGNVYLDNLRLTVHGPPGESLECAVQGPALKVTAALSRAYAKPRVLTAFYQQGLLYDCAVLCGFTDGRLEETLPLPPGATDVTVMLWDDLIPLCEAKRVSLSAETT